jgi:hypothetical protein
LWRAIMGILQTNRQLIGRNLRHREVQAPPARRERLEPRAQPVPMARMGTWVHPVRRVQRARPDRPGWNTKAPISQRRTMLWETLSCGRVRAGSRLLQRIMGIHRASRRFPGGCSLRWDQLASRGRPALREPPAARALGVQRVRLGRVGCRVPRGPRDRQEHRGCRESPEHKALKGPRGCKVLPAKRGLKVSRGRLVLRARPALQGQWAWLGRWA